MDLDKATPTVKLSKRAFAMSFVQVHEYQVSQLHRRGDMQQLLAMRGQTVSPVPALAVTMSPDRLIKVLVPVLDER
jgi:hypothetical protein